MDFGESLAEKRRKMDSHRLPWQKHRQKRFSSHTLISLMEQLHYYGFFEDFFY